MWFFDYLAIGFDEISSWFGLLESDVEVIPFIGDAAATVFGWIKGKFGEGSDWFNSASSWCDGIIDDIMELFTMVGDSFTELIDLDAWRDYIAVLVADIVGTISDIPTTILDTLGSTWDWLVALANDFPGAVYDVLGITWDWLMNLTSDFPGAVYGVLGSTWTDLGNMLGDFKDWVAAAVGEVRLSINYAGSLIVGFIPELIGEIYENSRDVIDNWVAYVYEGVLAWSAEQWESIIAILFDTLDRSWGMFEDSMKWLVGKLIDTVADAADQFKDKIWNLAEKIIEKI
jgi:hypothetical protein